MKYGTVWDAWCLARERQRIVEHLADGCLIGSKAHVQYLKDIKKLERQGFCFVGKIIKLIDEVDANK